MTLAEFQRAVQSRNRRHKRELKEQAQLNYIEADLIGRSIARLYSKSSEIPKITDVYPSLFEEEKKQQEKQAVNVSALRFKMFAQAYNEKFKKQQNKH